MLKGFLPICSAQPDRCAVGRDEGWARRVEELGNLIAIIAGFGRIGRGKLAWHGACEPVRLTTSCSADPALMKRRDSLKSVTAPTAVSMPALWSRAKAQTRQEILSSSVKAGRTISTSTASAPSPQLTKRHGIAPTG